MSRIAAAAAALALFMAAIAFGTSPSATAASLAGEPKPGVMATDGYFDISRIDAETYSIHEPQYWQRNIAYVLKGETRAILFDSGSGTRDMAWIADKVTKKPMTVIASHLHYDHIGSHASFAHVAMIDLPETRDRTNDNFYSPRLTTSLAPLTDGFHVTEWWKAGDSIDIGGRRIDVVHIPGHSTDSIALVDRTKGYAFVGDHLYGGTLFANLPGSDVATYLASTRRLLSDFPEIRTFFGAHETGRMPREKLEALERSLSAIVDGTAQGERVWWLGWMVARYPGDGFTILAAVP
jgi:hydroxyacylglutathione hydrolase